MKPGQRQSNLHFYLMTIGFRLRDRIRPPIRILREAGVRAGMTVMDFGCGPGGYSLSAARLTGPEGLVYAVDIHPLALRSVRKAMDKQGLSNIQTLSARDVARVAQGSVDMVLLYDVLHDLPDPHPVLTELHRVLRPNGVLSIRDHHMEEASILAMLASSSFLFAVNQGGTFRFQKTATGGTAL